MKLFPPVFVGVLILAGGCATQQPFLYGPRAMNPAPLIEEFLRENPHPALGDLQTIDMLNRLMSGRYGFSLIREEAHGRVYTGAWLVEGSAGSAVVYGSAKRINPKEWAVTELRVDFLDLSPSAIPRLELQRVYPTSE